VFTLVVGGIWALGNVVVRSEVGGRYAAGEPIDALDALILTAGLVGPKSKLLARVAEGMYDEGRLTQDVNAWLQGELGIKQEQ
jgi:hypothetical protein